jgi:hypothetical protein
MTESKKRECITHGHFTIVLNSSEPTTKSWLISPRSLKKKTISTQIWAGVATINSNPKRSTPCPFFYVLFILFSVCLILHHLQHQQDQNSGPSSLWGLDQRQAWRRLARRCQHNHWNVRPKIAKNRIFENKARRRGTKSQQWTEQYHKVL